MPLQIYRAAKAEEKGQAGSQEAAGLARAAETEGRPKGQTARSFLGGRCAAQSNGLCPGGALL